MSETGRAHIGQLLFLGYVDVEVRVPAVLSDQHAAVDLIGRRNEEFAALLQIDHRKAR